MPDPDELGRVFQPELAIAAGPVQFAAALRDVPPLDGVRVERGDGAGARRVPRQPAPHAPARRRVDMGEVMAYLRGAAARGRDMTNGAGNFSVWAHRFYEFRSYGTQLAPQSGSMGYGVPAAVAAKLVEPDRIVLAVSRATATSR